MTSHRRMIDRMGEAIRKLEAERDEARDEARRLMGLVKEAFCDGCDSAADDNQCSWGHENRDGCPLWPGSQIKKKLDGEGE